MLNHLRVRTVERKLSAFENMKSDVQILKKNNELKWVFVWFLSLA